MGHRPFCSKVGPITSTLIVDKVVEKLCAVIVADNLVNWLSAGIF